MEASFPGYKQGSFVSRVYKQGNFFSWVQAGKLTFSFKQYLIHENIIYKNTKTLHRNTTSRAYNGIPRNVYIYIVWVPQRNFTSRVQAGVTRSGTDGSDLNSVKDSQP